MHRPRFWFDFPYGEAPLRNKRMNVRTWFDKTIFIDRIIEETMKRYEKQNVSKAVITSLPKSTNHWSLGLIDSMTDPTSIIIEDDTVVVIKDKYPKAKFHYLVLPKEDISTIWKIQKNHEDLLWHMDNVAEELTKKHLGHNFLIGYHALPSMRRMHLHVISTDFDSPCLKTKHHWNTFTTPYFMPSKELCKQLKENGELKKISPTMAQHYLNEELKCHKCSMKPKNMSVLKRHLLLSHLSEK